MILLLIVAIFVILRISVILIMLLPCPSPDLITEASGNNASLGIVSLQVPQGFRV